MQFFGLIAAPFAAILAVFLVFCAVNAETLHFDNAWGRVALITFGPRIFQNVALIRRHFL